MNPADSENSQNAEVEAIIFAARNYVVPSRDLRPQVIEESRDDCRQRAWARRASYAALAMVVLWAVAMPGGKYLEGLRQHMCIPTSSEVERTAMRLAAESHQDAAWAIVDAFSQTRMFSADPVSVR